jgi:hypothetical protein
MGMTDYVGIYFGVGDGEGREIGDGDFWRVKRR